jgi:hypothetical protein
MPPCRMRNRRRGAVPPHSAHRNERCRRAVRPRERCDQATCASAVSEATGPNGRSSQIGDDAVPRAPAMSDVALPCNGQWATGDGSRQWKRAGNHAGSAAGRRATSLASPPRHTMVALPHWSHDAGAQATLRLAPALRDVRAMQAWRSRIAGCRVATPH